MENSKDNALKNKFIIETQSFGDSLRINAIDPETMVEVTLMVPANTPKEYIKKLAYNKLLYVKAKNKI
jgi:hypothetical protein